MPEQHVSAVSFPILTEADYAVFSALTHLGRRARKLSDGGCLRVGVVSSQNKKKICSDRNRDVINSMRLLTSLAGAQL